MSEDLITQVGEAVPTTSEYTEILTLIYNQLTDMSTQLDVILLCMMFASGILAAVGVGICITFFIGQILKTR